MIEEEISSLYRDFSSEMKEWNDKFYPFMRDNAAAVTDQAISELKSIFDRYVWDDAKRREERLNKPSTNNPCDYDPKNDVIDKFDISDNKATVDVQTQTGFRDMFRYSFAKKNDCWKLSKREVLDDMSSKWKSHHI